jgi:glycosyltransferase involved in cell wall biosynthesis
VNRSQHILYLGMSYDYGDPARGSSYEQRNIESSLREYCAKNGWTFSVFDYLAFGKQHGRSALSDECLRLCRQLRPSIVFSVLFHPDFDPHYEVFREVFQSLGIVTCNWFCDDQWRFESYSSLVAPHFNFFCTTSQTAVAKYKAAGLGSGLIKSQWACNTALYRPISSVGNRAVTFIGQPHGNRPQLVARLRECGVFPEVFGYGWPGGVRIPFHQMVRLFSSSRINLNLSKASQNQEEQIKGRNFEIPGCGGFQISFDAENLGDYYQRDQEIVIVNSIEEMAEKAKYYLEHEEERARIARAGYERTIREHTWFNRFDALFAQIVQSAIPPSHAVDEERVARDTAHRAEELIRVNRELWESRDYFVKRIDTLEDELNRSRAVLSDTVRENEELRAKVVVSEEGQRQERERASRQAKQLALLLEETEQLKRRVSEVTQDRDWIQSERNTEHGQFSQRIIALENVIHGLTQLKIFRLRHALVDQRMSLKKCARITYLLVAMAVPSGLRDRLRPVTIGLKQRFGIIPPPVATGPVIEQMTQQRWPRNRPLLTIIVPSFNYGRFIQSAIDSILAQTFQDFEVLIIDCSTDGETRELLKSIHHPKIQVIFREGRHLLGDNRNFGIKRARGKYVTCLDPDDILKPTYYEKAIYLLENGNFDIVSPSVQEFEQGSGRWMLHTRPQLSELIQCNLISVVAVYQKQVWVRSRGFHDYGVASEHVHEDWDFWVRSMALGARVMNIREPLMLYRIHGNNMSKAKNLPSLDEQRRQIREFNRDVLHGDVLETSRDINAVRYQVTDGAVNLLRSRGRPRDIKTILFALPYAVVGGAHKRFFELAVFLKRHGYSIIVVTTVPTTEDQMDLLHEYDAVTQDIFPLPQFLADQVDWVDCVRYLITSRGVGTILLGGSQFFYDHLEEIKDALPGLKVVDQQFNLAVHFDNNRHHLGAIDCTIAENETIEEKIRELDGETPTVCTLIQNGVDTQGAFAPSPTKPERPTPIPPHATVVSFIGRLSHEKGPDIFVDIVSRFAEQQDVFFVLAGPGPLFDSLKQEILRRGLSARVWMPGSVSSREFIEYSDIIVVPSRLDGRPNVVLEALSLEVPVIASAVGGIPSLIKDGESGILCASESLDSFAEAIRSLTDNRELRQSMAVEARKYAVEHFDSEKFLSQYLSVFETMESTEQQPNRRTQR